MKELSRRDFLKGTAAGALGLATMGLMGGISAKAAVFTPPAPTPPESRAPWAPAWLP